MIQWAGLGGLGRLRWPSAGGLRRDPPAQRRRPIRAQRKYVETAPEGLLMDLLWWILALVVVMLFLIGLGIAFADYNR